MAKPRQPTVSAEVVAKPASGKKPGGGQPPPNKKPPNYACATGGPGDAQLKADDTLKPNRYPTADVPPVKKPG